jgi:hypothetical protein
MFPCSAAWASPTGIDPVMMPMLVVVLGTDADSSVPSSRKLADVAEPRASRQHRPLTLQGTVTVDRRPPRTPRRAPRTRPRRPRPPRP